MFGIETARPARRVARMLQGAPSHETLQTFVSHDGQCLELRHLRPRDAASLRRFVRELSSRSVGLRFHVASLSNETLGQFAEAAVNDGRGAVRSWIWSPRSQPETVVGEVRLGFAATPSGGPSEVELGIVVADAYQRQGLGLRSVHFVQGLARQLGVTGVKATLLAHNRAVIGLFRQCDFELAPDADEPSIVHASWPRVDGLGCGEPVLSGWQRLFARMAGL